MSYSTLQSLIADWLNRSDLTTQIPTFISLAEAEFNREILVPERETTATNTVSAEALALPVSFWGMKSVYIVYDSAGDNVKIPLAQMSLQQLRTTYPADLTGLPGHYAVSGQQLIFGPAPEDDYAISLTYYTVFPYLNDTVTTNWLLDSHSDLYMAAAQWQASIFLRDWEAVTYFRGETGRLIEGVRKSGLKKSFGAAPIAIPSPVRAIRGVRA